MKTQKEPIEIDFEVENRPLTKEDELKISEYIKKRKEELNRKKGSVIRKRVQKV
jgi:hypothetical protein